MLIGRISDFDLMALFLANTHRGLYKNRNEDRDVRCIDSVHELDLRRVEILRDVLAGVVVRLETLS